MREIKFRSWLKGKMLNDANLYNNKLSWISKNGYECFSCLPSIDDAVLMQYTGLKDKNGVEVYEGDIVKSTRYIGGHYLDTLSDLVLVEFYNYKWVIQPVKRKLATPNVLSELESDCEVIGNIYENPELLESNNDD